MAVRFPSRHANHVTRGKMSDDATFIRGFG
jgi:hypothetical protein